MIRALPCVLDTEDHPRRQRSHHVIHCPSEISQQYCSMCCISTNNAFTVRVSSCPLSLPRIYCSSNDIFSVPKLNFNFLDKRPHFFPVFFLAPFPYGFTLCLSSENEDLMDLPYGCLTLWLSTLWMSDLMPVLLMAVC